jgi:hypothetical protein
MIDKDDQHPENGPERNPVVEEASPPRRKLLKTLAGAGGVVAAGALLPEKWTRPVVDRILVPAHAQATGVSGIYSETLGYDIAQDSVGNIPDQSFVFPLGGVTPAGDGTVTISNLQGDVDSSSDEQWTIRLGPVGSGIFLGLTNNGEQCIGTAPGSVFNVTQAQLQAAISGGSIEISAENGADINSFCETNTMDVTLTFPF